MNIATEPTLEEIEAEIKRRNLKPAEPTLDEINAELQKRGLAKEYISPWAPKKEESYLKKAWEIYKREPEIELPGKPITKKPIGMEAYRQLPTIPSGAGEMVRQIGQEVADPYLMVPIPVGKAVVWGVEQLAKREIPVVSKIAKTLLTDISAIIKDYIKFRRVKTPIDEQALRDFYTFGKERVTPETYDVLTKMPTQKVKDLLRKAMAGEDITITTKVPRFQKAPTMPPETPIEPYTGPMGMVKREVPIEPPIVPVTTPQPPKIVPVEAITKPIEVPPVRPIKAELPLEKPVKVIPTKRRLEILPRKEQLLTQIQEAITKAPDIAIPRAPTKPSTGAEESLWENYRRDLAKYTEEVDEKIGKVNFQIDGGAHIYNTKSALETFYNEVKRQPAVEYRGVEKAVKGVPRTIAARQEKIGDLVKGMPSGYFSDGHILIKGEPPAKAKFLSKIDKEGKIIIRETTPQGAKELIERMNEPTDPAEKLYYYSKDVDVGAGVSPTPIAGENAFVVFESRQEYYNYNQKLFNAISNRFPTATFGTRVGGALIAYVNKKPVAMLMPIREDVKVLPLEDLAKEAGLVKLTPEDMARKAAEGEKLKEVNAEIKKRGLSPSGAGFYASTKEIIDKEGREVIEMPELVKLAKELSGNYPVVKRLRTALGRFKSYPGMKEGNLITLRPDIFKSKTIPSMVLAHEIGHLIDWLPDYTLKRGNLIGRLHTMKSFLLDTYGDLNNKKLRAELQAFTQYWNPFDPSLVSANFTKYRYSAKELYADTLSGILNSPDKVKEIAPTFYASFWKNIDKKPEVSQALMDLKNILSLPEPERLLRRQEDFRKMQQKSEGLYRQKHLEAQKRARRPLKDVITEGIIDINAPTIRRFNKAIKEGKSINPDDNPLYWLEERNYISGKITNDLERIDNLIRKPLAEQGMNDEIIGEYLFHNNIIHSMEITEGVLHAKHIARPLGFSPETSQKQLDLLKTQLGDEKYKLLVDKMNVFYKEGIDLMQECYQPKGDMDAGIINDEQMTLAQNNPYYATTQVLDHIQTYISPSFIHQIGTLKESANSFTATIMKRISTRMALEKNIVRVKVYKFLRDLGEAETAKRIYMGKERKPEFKPAEGMGLLEMKIHGKWFGASIDPYIADSIEYQPSQTTINMGKIFSIVNTKWFRPIFTTWNLGFQSFNLLRDFQRAVKANPHKSLILSMLDTAKGYYKAMPHALNRIKGIEDQVITEMRDNKMLGITYQQTIDMGDINDFKEMNYLMEKAGIGLTTGKHPSNPVKKPLDWMEDLGNLIETLPKVGGFIQLKESNYPIPMKVIGHMIRNYYGSPDFRGFGGWGAVYNNVFLFSNAMKQGFRSDWEIGFRNPLLIPEKAGMRPKTNTGYWWKTFQMNIIPKILMVMAGAGVMGAYTKRIMDGATEYDKTNYTVIPFWLDSYGNSVYLRIPQDETGRLIGALAWKGMKGKDQEIGKTIADIGSVAGGQMAPSLNPMAEVIVGSFQYMVGQNPIDFFRGRGLFNYNEEKLLKAKGFLHPELLKKYGLFTAQQVGLPVPSKYVYEYKKEDPMSVLSKIVTNTPILSRFIRVTKYGLTEKKLKRERELEAKKIERKK